MRILINVPNLSKPGGVSTLYNILKIEKKFPNITLFIIHSSLPSILGLGLKYIEFFFKMPLFNVVHLNPSLNKKSVYRDAVYAFIALITFRKLVVYWHGWDEIFEEKIKNSFFLKLVFNLTFNKANLSIVLGTVFKDKLINLGCKNKIVIETNAAESKYLKQPPLRKISSDKTINLLFIARLDKRKGMYIAIDALNILNENDNNRYKLIIAGIGEEEEEIIKIANKNKNVTFKGYVLAEEKHEILLNSDILFFPTYYSEGLPLTILEGFMYGLPIVSRPVGGIKDVVENEENGFLLNSKSGKDFAKIINSLCLKPEVYLKISKNNIEKQVIFKPENVSNRIFNLYKEL